jgi:hypothetical protein
VGSVVGAVGGAAPGVIGTGGAESLARDGWRLGDGLLASRAAGPTAVECILIAAPPSRAETRAQTPATATYSLLPRIGYPFR